MRVLASAKINIHLRVGSRRPDGFHPLLSWMTTVGLFDTLTFEPTALNGIAAEGRVSLRSDMPGLPCDERNLIVRIANLFRNEFKPQELRDFDVFPGKEDSGWCWSWRRKLRRRLCTYGTEPVVEDRWGGECPLGIRRPNWK